MNIHRRSSTNSGFTFIELLVVITIIIALAVAVFVALNPSRRLADSRDARRTSDVDSILTAIHQYIVDNEGALPPGLTAGMSETQIGTATTGCAVATGGCGVTAASCVNLTTPLAEYLESIPVDPSTTFSDAETGYSVVVNANGIVTVRACGTENAADISASR